MNTTTDTSIELLTKWEAIGYVAGTHDRPEKSSPCSGPRQAAWELAQRLFGHPNFKLIKFAPGRWKAEERQLRGSTTPLVLGIVAVVAIHLALAIVAVCCEIYHARALVFPPPTTVSARE